MHSIAKHFLAKKLKVLSAEYPNIHIRCEFYELINTYLIEITPQDQYYNNKNLDNSWIKISEEFMDKFPNEMTSFITNDSLYLTVKNPELIISSGEIIMDNFSTDSLNLN